MNHAAADGGQRLCQLVRLVVVDQVAAVHDGLEREPVERAHGVGQHLRRQRLLWPEGGLEGAAEPVEEWHPGGRLLVTHVRVREQPEECELADRS